MADFQAGRAAGLSLCAGVLLLAACASPDPVLPPAPLTPVKKTLTTRQVWSVSVGDKDERGLTHFVPKVLDGTIYAASIDGNVIAVNSDDGKLRWRQNLDYALASGVAGDEQQIYVSSRDGSIVALSREDGSVRWEYAMSSEVLAPVAAGFGIVVARSADGRITGLNSVDGSERWSNTYTPPALTVYGYGSPSLLEKGVLVGLDDGKVIALSLDAGRVLWESVVAYPTGRSEVERLVDVDADVLFDNQHIYAANYQGALVKLEPARGRRLWSAEISTTVGMSQLDDKLFVTDSFDRVIAISKSDGTTLWQQDKLGGRRLTRPVVINGGLVVADFEGFVHVLSLTDGTLIGRTRSGDGPAQQLTRLDDSSVLLQTRAGSLRLVRTGG